LLDLIGLGEGTSRLEVEDLIYSIAGENVVASSDALCEADS
jgi:hypothetical protein